MIAFADKSDRSAKNIHSSEPASVLWYRPMPGDRRIIQIKFHVARNKQIEPPIVIVIAPSCSRRPASERYSRLLRNIRERSIMIVVQEHRPWRLFFASHGIER